MVEMILWDIDGKLWYKWTFAPFFSLPVISRRNDLYMVDFSLSSYRRAMSSVDLWTLIVYGLVQKTRMYAQKNVSLDKKMILHHQNTLFSHKTISCPNHPLVIFGLAMENHILTFLCKQVYVNHPYRDHAIHTLW